MNQSLPFVYILMFMVSWQDVPVTMDGSSSELRGESKQDIMLDSNISHSRHVEVGRELEPWRPDKDDPLCPELENVFDSPWSGYVIVTIVFIYSQSYSGLFHCILKIVWLKYIILSC